MIQANELRIGNYIADRGGKIWQIDCWESQNKVAAKAPYIGDMIGMPMYGHPLTEEVDYLQPIFLTPEILEKCGFAWSIYHQAHYLSGFDYVVDICDGYCRICKYRRTVTDNVLVRIKYLHQLQNLYFSLTGQELNIQL